MKRVIKNKMDRMPWQMMHLVCENDASLKSCFSMIEATFIGVRSTRAGLKLMQPMQMHWAPRLWGPRPSVGPAPCVWIVVHFYQIFLALTFSRNG